MDNLKQVIWWSKIEDNIKSESFIHLCSKLLWWYSNLETYFQVRRLFRVPWTARRSNQFSSQKTLESPLDCKEIQPVHSEGDQPWDFFGRNDAKAETPVLWPPHAKS